MSLTQQQQAGSENSRTTPGSSRPNQRRKTFPPAWMRTRTGVAGLGLAALLLVMLIAWRVAAPGASRPTEVSFSTIASAIAAGELSEVQVHSGGSRIVAVLSEPRADGTTSLSSEVPGAGISLADLERWAAGGLVVNVHSTSAYRSPEGALVLLPTLLLLILGGGLLWRMRTGSARRFLVTPAERHLTMNDVGGAREARADLQDVIAFLAEPQRFLSMGARCPKGVLLVGPPGTGKTLLARAVAGEAGVPVISASGSDFTEMYVGVGASRVRSLAKRARESAPCIVFIDEFDSIGGRRGRPNRTSEEETTLNQLLVEMDGMAGNEGVVWMAATNREDMLDPAVRRPGRFDRVVEVSLPTQEDRLAILRIHARNTPLAPDVTLERLARLTPGHSGAELANLLNEAVLIAVQDGEKLVTNAHIEQARDRILLGRVRSGVVVSEAERRLIALHEAGHAVVGLVACPEDTLHKVTIEARGRSLGAAHFAPEADRHLYPRRYLEGVIAKALGGRAAELHFLGEDQITSGAGSDLIQATSVARRMAGEFGMTNGVGLVSVDPAAQGGSASPQLQAMVDNAVSALITAQAERANSIVEEFHDAVEAIANALLDQEVLDAEEVLEIAREYGVVGGRDSERSPGERPAA